MILLSILAVSLIGVFGYIGFKYIYPKQVEDIMGDATAPFIRSKVFPDKQYVGQMSKLDPSLRVMFPNVLFGFPTDPLIVKEFKYFEVDNNKFEVIVFDNIGTKHYILIHDSYENTTYFLNRLMTQATTNDYAPITQDVIVLDENDTGYTYTDLSGLIEIQVYSENNKGERQNIQNNSLIRVYEREVTPDDNEFLFLMCDKPSVIDYYVGFRISILQLENI
jgi:hypothetical protein